MAAPSATDRRQVSLGALVLLNGSTGSGMGRRMGSGQRISGVLRVGIELPRSRRAASDNYEPSSSSKSPRSRPSPPPPPCRAAYLLRRLGCTSTASPEDEKDQWSGDGGGRARPRGYGDYLVGEVEATCKRLCGPCGWHQIAGQDPCVHGTKDRVIRVSYN